MLNISQLTTRQVIHCPTVQLYMLICELMIVAKLEAPAPESWTNNKSETCVLPGGTVGYRSFFLRQGYDVLDAQLFMAGPATEYEAYAMDEPPPKEHWIERWVKNLIVFAKRKSSVF